MTHTPDEYGAEQSLDDPVDSDLPEGEETPGDYEAQEDVGGVSVETGVVYDAFGEPETAPGDEEPADESDTSANAATSATTEE